MADAHSGHGGPWGTLIDKAVPWYWAMICAIQADCLSMKTSWVSWPASIISRACSQTAVVPGSTMAVGTASMSVPRSEERRGGKECVSKGRARGSRSHKNKNNKQQGAESIDTKET